MYEEFIVTVCPKCGKVLYGKPDGIEPCYYCNTIPIETEFNGSILFSFNEKTKEEEDIWKEKLHKKYVFNNPNYDPELFQKRADEEYQMWLEDEKFFRLCETTNKFEALKLTEELGLTATSNQVKCPYCQSTNLKKITTAGRIGSTFLFGLGSKKIGKQWHCNTCKSDF